MDILQRAFYSQASGPNRLVSTDDSKNIRALEVIRVKNFIPNAVL